MPSDTNDDEEEGEEEEEENEDDEEDGPPRRNSVPDAFSPREQAGATGRQARDAVGGGQTAEPEAEGVGDPNGLDVAVRFQPDVPCATAWCVCRGVLT